MELPEAGGGGACAAEDGCRVEFDGDGGGGESCDAAVVAEGANGNERAGSERRKYMSLACGRREKGYFEEGGVGGRDGASVGEDNGDAGVGWALIVTGCKDGDEVACTAGVGNAGGGGLHGERRWCDGGRRGGD